MNFKKNCSISNTLLKNWENVFGIMFLWHLISKNIIFLWFKFGANWYNFTSIVHSYKILKLLGHILILFKGTLKTFHFCTNFFKWPIFFLITTYKTCWSFQNDDLIQRDNIIDSWILWIGILYSVIVFLGTSLKPFTSFEWEEVRLRPKNFQNMFELMVWKINKS